MTTRITTKSRHSPLRALALGSVAALAFAGAAHAVPAPAASCKLDFSPAAAHWTIQSWNPFGSTVPAGDFEVTVHNRGDTSCTFRIVTRLDADPFGLHGPGGARLPYALLEQVTSTDGTPLGGRSDPSGPFTLAPDQQQVLRYRLQVGADDVPRDGTYRQTVILSAETSPGDAAKQTPVQLALDVIPSAVMGLRGSFTPQRGGALVDLGELTPGPASLPLNLWVQSTGGYRISVRSENLGFLRLGASEWRVRYGMTLNGRSMNLQDGSDLDVPNQSNVRKDALPIGFVIGEVAQKRAGVYSDLVVISIAPL